jgi:alpha-tubulin suppressor-like RCC1 family protein
MRHLSLVIVLMEGISRSVSRLTVAACCVSALLLLPNGCSERPTAPMHGTGRSAALLMVSGLPRSRAVGQPMTFVVTVTDASGNVVTDYSGTLHFASTDSVALLPPNYAFVAGDGGSHAFTVVFRTAGRQAMTVTDAAATSIAGDGTVTVVMLGGFATISAGVVSSCGLTASAIAFCWGTNDLGRLGDGTTQDNAAPVPVSGGLHFSTLRTGSLQTCGLTTDGEAYCWGSNLFDALGTGTTGAPQSCYSADWADEGVGNQPCSPSPLPVSGGLRFVALSSGASTTTCGLTANAAAYCWGYNRDGEFGSGTTENSPSPVPVSGGLQFASLSSGGYHSCGVTVGGSAYCWGNNYYGQLGDGATTNRTVPGPVSGALHFAAISTGAYHSCGLTIDGTTYCWGWNNFGQLGSTTSDIGVPVPVSGGPRFTMLSTASWHTCALAMSGEAYCWGENSDGQLGDGTTTNRYVPVLVLGGLRFVALSAGHRHTCGVTTDGTYCWGANDYWQFGDGTATSSNVPVKVGGPP